jgi:hypothetical protein
LCKKIFFWKTALVAVTKQTNKLGVFMTALVSRDPGYQGVNFFQTAAIFGTIGGGVTVVTCGILGCDYTYPFTVTVLSGFAWLSIRLTQSAQQQALKIESNSLRGQVKKQIDSNLDEMGMQIIEVVNSGTDILVDATTTASKTAVVAFLPGSGVLLGPSVNASLDVSSNGTKNLLHIGNEASVRSSIGVSKRSTNKSVDNSL